MQQEVSVTNITCYYGQTQRRSNMLTCNTEQRTIVTQFWYSCIYSSHLYQTMESNPGLPVIGYYGEQTLSCDTQHAEVKYIPWFFTVLYNIRSIF